MTKSILDHVQTTRTNKEDHIAQPHQATNLCNDMELSARDKKTVVLERQLDGLSRERESGASRGLLIYATLADRLILGVSLVCAVLGGILNPLIAVIFGQLVGVFDRYRSDALSEDAFSSKVSTYSLYYVYLAVTIFVLIFISTVGFYYSGEHIIRSIRNAYLKATLGQNMAYFDSHGPGHITTRIFTDMNLIQEGITSKLSIALTAFATFASALVVVFIMDWRIALILSPTFVIMVCVFTWGGAYVVSMHKEFAAENGKASGVAEETIASMRQVSAFGMQEHFTTVYADLLSLACDKDIKSRNMVAVMIAWSNAVPCLVYALAFWSGSIFLVKGWIDVSQLTTVAMVVTIGAFAIVRVGPAAQALTSTVSSAELVLNDISRRSTQDPFATGGVFPDDVQGQIELRHLGLIYPTRQEQVVLQDVSFLCPARRTTAIVGSSGSGKSSIISLLERFYEPTAGQINLDGRDIQSLNLGWLRGKMALVGQSPVLFDTTVFQNILYGRLANGTTRISDEAARESVYSAARDANAHDFIMTLPDGYQTRVGSKGYQLSGGQRQRIAIARALIRDPAILLLDEATSALDSKSESAVQVALDSAARHRTTIIVAHRLSTVRHADNIIVMSKGRIVETGIHEDLIALDGHYASSVRAQQISGEISASEKNNEIEIESRDRSSDMISSEQPIFQVDATPSASTSILATQRDQTERSSLSSALAFIMKMNKGDYVLLTFGLFCSVIAGLSIPGQSVIFAKVLEALGLPSAEFGKLRSSINLYSGLFFMLSGITFIAWLGLGMAFSYSTARLTRRLKTRVFRSIVSQDVAYFDDEDHTTGRLLATLTSSCENVVGLSGPVMGGTLCFISTILGGVILSISLGWKLALVCTTTTPIIVACGWVRLQVLVIFDGKTRRNGQDAASYASEIVQAVSTVASLGLEEVVLHRYDQFLGQQSKDSLRSILLASSLYAASQSVVYFCAALAFWYGSTLVAEHEYSLFAFFICFSALITGSQIAGSIFTFAPDASKAMHASWELQQILRRASTVNMNSSIVDDENRKINAIGASISENGERSMDGSIEFMDVIFSYPSRPGIFALDGLNLRIEPGQHIALVGPSGCGKSTVLSLIERFYDPDSGSVLCSGQDISKLDLIRYRSKISLVSQDAVLYSGSIRENIALGMPGQEISDREILDVCKQANILDFVNSLEEGLSSFVGPGGCTLSGGQKQRISIARALLRKPQILLLDEATSALDTESEIQVQLALESASEGKTTVSIAHRLSTVQKADCIFVLESGRVVESGRHEELLASGGRYWEFVQAQNLH